MSTRSRVGGLGVICLCGMLGVLSACGGGGGGSGSANETTQAQGSVGAAVVATFASLSQNQSVSEGFESLVQRGIIKVTTFTACDAVEQGVSPEGITMSADGTDGTYGSAANPVTIAAGTDDAFCSDGGVWASWTIPSASALEMSCETGDGTTFTATMSGSGVFKESDSATLIRGDWNSTVGDAIVITACSFDIPYTEGATFENASCDGIGTIPTDYTCTPPGGDEGGGSEPDGEADGAGGGAPTCTTDADCQAIASNGECFDGACGFACSVDADCDALEAMVGEEMVCQGGFCEPGS